MAGCQIDADAGVLSPSGSTPMKSLGVTAPAVSRTIASAVSRESQGASELQRAVMVAGETPTRRAKSCRVSRCSVSQSVSFMVTDFSVTKVLAQRKFQPDCMDANLQQRDHVRMVRAHPKPHRQRHFIREWRKFRHYKQHQVAEMTGLSVPTISQIENGKQPYSQQTLEALAAALSCEPADLLVRNPLDPEGMWSLWDRAKPGERKQILAIVDAMLKTGTGQ